MKTKNRSLFSKICKCYSKKLPNVAAVQTEDDAPGLTVFDDPYIIDEVTFDTVSVNGDLE